MKGHNDYVIKWPVCASMLCQTDGEFVHSIHLDYSQWSATLKIKVDITFICHIEETFINTGLNNIYSE